MPEVTNGWGLAAAIVQALASLGWPAAIAFSAYIFRAEISRLLPNLHIKHGESEVSFRRVEKLVEQVQVHELTQQQQVRELPPPSTSTSNLSALTDHELRLRVEDVALQMREMQNRFKSEDSGIMTRRTSDRETWEAHTKELLARSDRHRHEWQTQLLPDAVALRDEIIRRLGNEIQVDTRLGDFVFDGMLAGPYPLNEGALTLERLARNLTGSTGTSATLVQ
ncbi:hypothetical protein [Mesorhizobium sp. WSM3626]|uniref:hypothetical protein n=1 Tax=Mesorhizobium sp. WSM3626 TaxID=1040987 RepID=UPI0012EBC903|nr:hypothetical protein [Mesorhizobium sp. WSM3626]